MRYVYRWVMATLFVMSAGLLAGASVSLAGSVSICHVPPGNPSNTHMINVAPVAVKAHVKNHGDAVCAGEDRDCCLTDDGALCTNLADDLDNCGECGHSCGDGETCEDGECCGQRFGLECPPYTIPEAECVVCS